MSEWKAIESDPPPKGVEVLLFEPAIKQGQFTMPDRMVIGTWPAIYPRKASHWRPLPAPPATEPTP